jgi:tetratricopeptide (TPR) repeat protein
MNQDTLEHLYVTGDYSVLLEEIGKLAYDHPSTNLSDIEKAICVSYHSRALIRFGEINEAENLIHNASNIILNKSFSIPILIYQTSIINLHNTQGNIVEALREGRKTETLIKQKKNEISTHPELLSYWSAFLYFLIGVAYFYKVENDLAYEYFLKSLDVNQANQFIKAKCFYYMAFLESEKGNIPGRFELLEESLEIFQAINAQQGMAWICAWQGQYLLQAGDFLSAQSKFSQAIELFKSIGEPQGLSLVDSLIGLMLYQQGKSEQAEEILEEAFDSSLQIQNPTIFSYCFLPLVFLYIESNRRSKAQECFLKYQELSKTVSNEIVKLQGSLVEAILLKSSSRFIDKGRAQQIFLKLLEDAYSEKYPTQPQVLPTSDKDFSFLIVYHLIDLYIEEYKLTEDEKIMLEAQQLIDNHIQHVHDQKFSPKLAELSFLKGKLLIIDGEIEEALEILEQVKQDANTNNFHRMEEKVGMEITKIEKEYQKWDAAVSIRDRIEKVQVEEYLKEAQQIIGLRG